MIELALGFAIITQDQTALRPSPKSSVKPAAVLFQGETLEVRGERLDYLQVWDHRRERGGYVRASQVRAVASVGSRAVASWNARCASSHAPRRTAMSPSPT